MAPGSVKMTVLPHTAPTSWKTSEIAEPTSSATASVTATHAVASTAMKSSGGASAAPSADARRQVRR